MSPLVVPRDIYGLPIVVSVSGGKDSTALALALRESDIEVHSYVFADTGWEAPEVLEYVDYLETVLGPIVRVGDPRGMVGIAREKAGFPFRLGRWCTEFLKLIPIREYHRKVADETETDTAAAVGIRWQESDTRATYREVEEMPPPEDDDVYITVWRPLLSWTVEDVLRAHHRHGVRVNPLYEAGHDRVGCYPCIMSGKDEIRLVAKRMPERIDEIEALEAEFTAERARRNATGEGAFQHPQATFFQGKLKTRRTTRLDEDGEPIDETMFEPMPIRDAVKWSKTLRGGRRLALFDEHRGGCMKWGLCDIGGSK